MLNRVLIAATLALAVASSAAAQSTSTSSQTTGTQTAASTPSSSSEVQTRPATTTFMGDTGLWYVPTGEVLPPRNGRSARIVSTSTTTRASPTSRTGR
jgi:hypothetical protein